MNNSGKNIFIWVIIALVLVLVFNLFNQNQNQTRIAKVPYSEFLKLVDTDKSYPVICNETGDLLGEIDRSIVMKSMKSKS